MKRLPPLLVALLIVVAACGGAGETTTSVAPTTSAAPTTEPPIIEPPTTASSTIGPTTPPTITAPPTSVEHVSAYMSVGGWVAPVARALEPGADPVLAAVTAMLAGSTADEKAGSPSIHGVAEDVELLGLTVANGVAVVDLPKEFDTPTGTSGETQTLAALTFTLTEFDDINEVVLMIDGERIQYFGGHGWDITPSIDRDTFMANEGAFGAVAVCEPAWWLPVTSPVTVAGYAQGFLGNVMFALYDNEGLELASGEVALTPLAVDFATYGSYEISIPYTVDFAQLGAVMVWDGSAGASVQANLVEQAIWLMPGSY